MRSLSSPDPALQRPEPLFSPLRACLKALWGSLSQLWNMEDNAYFQGCFILVAEEYTKRLVIVCGSFQRWRIMNWEETGLGARSGKWENKTLIPILMPKVSHHKMMALWCESYQCQEPNTAMAKLNTTQKMLGISSSHWRGIHGKPVWRSMGNFIFQSTKVSVHRASYSSTVMPPEFKTPWGSTFLILHTSTVSCISL